jgi:glycerol-3-phosphate O-acyltransferase / dihydroxyacetone phosphate acyltransferase
MRRLIAWVGRFAAALLFRRVEVAGQDRYPDGRPVLLVANHFNGFVDPVLITSTLGRTPRFVARAGLERLPIGGWLLRRAGVVFVHRRVDEGAAIDNDAAFHECHRALVDGDVVAIFPEGTTHDRPRIDPIKTGAARIALGARAAGAEHIVILPVGLTFPDKVALRSSALVQFGHPIELDTACTDPADASDTEAVRNLTAVIDQGLRDVSPDFADVETALALEQAALVTLSSTAEPDPSLEARYELARRLGRSAPEAQTLVRTAIGRYLTMLTGLRLTDRDVIAPTSPARLIRSAIGIAVLVVLLGGLVAATAIINVWPAALVAVASLLVKTPVSKGTARVLVGLISFPAAWITAGVLSTDGALGITLVVVAAAVGALAAIWLVERAMALALMLLRWQAQRERIGTVGLALSVRAEVASAVRSAVAGT